jgi:hypothetical protein
MGIAVGWIDRYSEWGHIWLLAERDRILYFFITGALVFPICTQFTNELNRVDVSTTRVVGERPFCRVNPLVSSCAQHRDRLKCLQYCVYQQIRSVYRMSMTVARFKPIAS